MGNALEAPVTEKDTVRFERAPTALKVSDLLDRCFFVPRTNDMNVRSLCQVTAIQPTARSYRHDVYTSRLQGLFASLIPAAGGNARIPCTNPRADFRLTSGIGALCTRKPHTRPAPP